MEVHTWVKGRIPKAEQEFVNLFKVDTKFKYINEKCFEIFDKKLQNINIANRDAYITGLKLLNELFIEAIYDEFNKNLTDETINLSLSLKDMAYTLGSNSHYFICHIICKHFPGEYLKMTQKDRSIMMNSVIDRAKRKFVERYNIKNIELLGDHTVFLDSTISFINIDNALPYEVLGAKMAIFFLTKEYYASNEFKIQLNKVKSLNKKVLLVELQDCSANENYASLNDKIYKVYQHKEYKFEGHETRKLLKAMEEYYEQPLKVHIFNFLFL